MAFECIIRQNNLDGSIGGCRILANCFEELIDRISHITSESTPFWIYEFTSSSEIQGVKTIPFGSLRYDVGFRWADKAGVSLVFMAKKAGVFKYPAIILEQIYTYEEFLCIHERVIQAITYRTYGVGIDVARGTDLSAIGIFDDWPSPPFVIHGSSRSGKSLPPPNSAHNIQVGSPQSRTVKMLKRISEIFKKR